MQFQKGNKIGIENRFKKGNKLCYGHYWDISWNPVSGCSPCSPGCLNCWARRMAYRLKGRYGYPKDDPFRVTFHFEKAEQPLEWKKPKTIFVCLMSDIFHEDIKKDDRARIFRSMMAANWHTYLILTKRIQNAQDYNLIFKNNPNWRLGVTVCNPDELWKIDSLRKIPAAVHWVSFEPLLANLGIVNLDHIEWCCLGGETGPKARPMHPDWVRSLVQQSRGAGVPMFVKQLSGKNAKNMDKWPEELQVREMP